MHMHIRLPVIVTALLATMSFAAAPALATEPSALEPAPSIDLLRHALGTCTDSTRPNSRFSAKSVASSKRMLRGSARDVGCGVALVTISIARVNGNKCEFLTPSGRLGRPTKCSRSRWLIASGTKKWRVSLQNLPKGTYRVRTRAIDYAVNVQRSQLRRLTLR